MDIQLEKYKLMERLVGLKDEAVISKLKRLKASLPEASNWSSDISDTEKLFIESGLKDIENGNTLSHDEVMKDIKAIYDI